MNHLIILSLLFLSACSTPKLFSTTSSEKVLKICAVGDTGLATEVQREVSDAMLKENCDRLVLLGDIVYPAGIRNAQDPKVQTHFLNYYKEFKKIFIILGNHDYRGNIDAWKDVAKEHSNVVHPGTYYQEKINDACLLYLDTNFFGKYYKMLAEVQWLRRERKDCKFTIAFSHHPYSNSGPHHGPAKGFTKYFLEKLVMGKVDFLISGHEHILTDEGMIKGTHQIVSGAGGKPQKGFRAGYLIFNLDLESPKKSSYQLKYL